MTSLIRMQTASNADHEDACFCHSGELSRHAAIALESGGVDKLARTQSAPALDRLATALAACVRNGCALHADCGAEVSDLNAIVAICDAEDERHWAERAERDGQALLLANTLMGGAL
jgi:hypothetical protein